eukprot:4665094-Lingulodinium_polyedra.AAC.1
MHRQWITTSGSDQASTGVAAASQEAPPPASLAAAEAPASAVTPGGSASGQPALTPAPTPE